jgi:CubicO group peptidase (beta-lactamase class C family)
MAFAYDARRQGNNRMSRAGFSTARLDHCRDAMHHFVDTGDVAGCETLAWRHGEIARVDVLGSRDGKAQTPMSADSLFRIASMTKPVTSVAALMLVEEGCLGACRIFSVHQATA